MGRGTIVSGGTDGQYTVDLDYGTARAQQIIDYLESAIDGLDDAIAQAETTVNDVSLSLSAALSALDDAIVEYVETGEKDKVTSVTDQAANLSAQYEKAKISATRLKYERISLQSRLNSMQGLDTEETESVWCVDLTEDASGEVATIELNGEGTTLIAAGGESPGDSDGVMTARGVQDPNQVFFNAAILPGWQKYMPTFRAGTISSIDYEEDTCTVTLDTARSSAQSLPINQSSVLTDVPITYMNCNAVAFDNGDDVVVRFNNQSWDEPEVIGFVSHPKPCGPARIAFVVDIGGVVTVSGTNQPAGTQGTTVDTTPQSGLTVSETPYDDEYDGFSISVGAFDGYDLRIRFDVAWTQRRLDDDYFDAELRTDLTSKTDGESLVLSPSTGAARSIDPSNGSGMEVVVHDLEMVPEDDGTPFAEVLSGTITNSTYVFAEVPDNEESNDYIECVPEEAHAFITQYYSPPSDITVIMDGREIPYTLETIGPPPQLQDAFENYYWSTHPDDEGGGSLQVHRVYNNIAAIYRRST